MGKLLKLGGLLFAWFCVGTVLAMGAGVGYLVSTGTITNEKWFAILAVVHNVDLTPKSAKAPTDGKEKEERPSENSLAARARTLRSLDLDLKTQAIEKGLIELKTLENTLKEDRRRYDQLKNSFDQALVKLEQDAKNAGVLETQRTLEVVAPKQAKDQLLKMITDGGMNDAVAILKGMAIDKRKKIFAEFKDTSEAEKLAEILKQIRTGDPEKKLITDTRRDIQQPPGQL